MEEIFPNIYRMQYKQLDTDLPIVNSYLIRSERVLIDAGPDDQVAYQQLQQNLMEVGLQVTDLKYILLTHHHVDHTGMLHFFPFSIPLVAVNDFPYYCSENYLHDANRFTSNLQLSMVYVSDIKVRLFQEQTPLKLGHRNMVPISKFEFNNFRFIECSGHSSTDMVIIYQNTFAFTGDILIPKVFFNCVLDLLCATGQPNDHMRVNYKQELEMLENEKFKEILPGHGEPLDLQKVLQQTSINKKRLRRTEKKVMQATYEGTSLEAVINKCFGPFLQYSHYLPFSDVFSVLGAENMLDSVLIFRSNG
ncbi:MAG: MBL fold metallo-hydrolase [Sporolactobacillus sp.]